MSIPLSDWDGVERIVSFAETLNLFHMRRVGQRAVEFVSPPVILALNPARKLAFFLLAKHGAAMATDIVESADIALFVARDDDTGIGDLAQKIIARIRNLAATPRAEPHIKMDCFHLALEPCWISVVALRKRHCVRDSDCGPGI